MLISMKKLITVNQCLVYPTIANFGFWVWSKHCPLLLTEDVGVIAYVPTSIPGFLAPNPRDGSQVQSFTLFSLSWQFWNLYGAFQIPICFNKRKERECVLFLQSPCLSFCKTIVFFFFLCATCMSFSSAFFFFYLKVISGLTRLFLPNPLANWYNGLA